MKTRTRLLLPVVLVAAAAALAGCGAGAAGAHAPAPAAPAVTTAVVATQELHDWAEFTGRLEAVDQVAIRPRVGGYVESAGFIEGARVAPGDLLFQIDPRPFKAEVDRLTAERDRATAERKLARSYADRAERLLAQNATSREDYEQLAANAAVADARLAAAQAALEAARLNLSFTRVTSPIAGRVSRAVVTPGNLVDSSTLLTTVVSDSPVYAYFDVDEQTFLAQLHRGAAGNRVHVGLIDEDGYPHSARLDFVDNQLDGDHGTIRARAVLDNADGALTPGLFVRLKLESPRSFRAALVDDRAIGTDLDRKFVFVVNDEHVVQYRAVELGREVEGLRVVKSGLTAGDVVIVNGVQRVRPGVTVDATQVAMDRGSPGALERLAAASDDTDPTVAHNVR